MVSHLKMGSFCAPLTGWSLYTVPGRKQGVASERVSAMMDPRVLTLLQAQFLGPSTMGGHLKLLPMLGGGGGGGGGGGWRRVLLTLS